MRRRQFQRNTVAFGKPGHVAEGKAAHRCYFGRPQRSPVMQNGAEQHRFRVYHDVAGQALEAFAGEVGKRGK